jgi:hypothetical protein
MARVCAVAAHTSSPLPDLRFHHGKCAQSIEGEDGKMRPTTASPLTVSVNRQEKEDRARYRLRARHEFSPTLIWIEHDMQLVRDSPTRCWCCITARNWHEARRIRLCPMPR